MSICLTLTLHSNMFLLIHTWYPSNLVADPSFTFQYVSINTCSPYQSAAMFSNNFTFQYVSINTAFSIVRFLVPWIFTFQYVSINTPSAAANGLRKPSLHSNMFLLIQMERRACALWVGPLHSNMFLLIREQQGQMSIEDFFFTFQYVSINTQEESTHHRTSYRLYIPICFY